MLKPRRRLLVLDFDGVLHSYTSPWVDAATVLDPPVPGAREFLLEAFKKFDICVVSSRSHEPGGREAMARWCVEQLGGKLLEVGDQHAVAFGEYVLSFPSHKPPAFLTIDDRAVTFTGTWPDVQELLKFKPWNK